MKVVILFAILAAASALDCCEYSLETGVCDESCPGVCVFRFDDCPNLVGDGCYLLDRFTVPNWDEDCTQCVCEQTRGLLPEQPAAGKNKFGGLKVPHNIGQLLKGGKSKKKSKL
jgi:hypothetical protein